MFSWRKAFFAALKITQEIEQTKFIENVKLVAYFLFGLFMFFSLLCFLAGLIGFVVIRDWNLLVGGFLWFTIFFGTGLVVRRLKLESTWKAYEQRKGIKPKTLREILSASTKGLLVLVCVIIFSYFFQTYILSYPETITIGLAQDVMKSIMSLNGILIGFSGVIYAQLLWAIHSKGNTLYQYLLSTNPTNVDNHLQQELDKLHQSRITMFINILYSTVPFVYSILLCLNKMATIQGNTVSTRILIEQPILWTIVGIGLMCYALVRIDLLPSRIL
jgi:hypothetical protein